MKRILFITTLLAPLFSCNQHTASQTAAAPAFDIQFTPFIPKELTAGATPEQLSAFAWTEFFSLNWKSSFDKNAKRDYPDTTWTYETDKSPYPSLQVWETYGHKEELRPYSNVMQPFDAPPHYSIGVPLTPVSPNDSYKLFDNLDENNEIGSCNIYGRAKDFNEQYMVLFQAKVNREEYEYIYNNYPKKALLDSAEARTARNISRYSAYYPSAPGSCNCPQGAQVICLPCGGATIPGSNNQTYTGAVEIKTAWRQLTSKDDPSRFFIRNVIVYQKNNGVVQYTNKQYALIGLHIIHKTVNYPDFLFATFEHVDVQSNDMALIELDSHGNEVPPLQINYPRLHPIAAVTDASTQYAHQLLSQKNPNSIWQYYRLVGVQSVPSNDTTAYSFFQANYVVESDSTLANFRGSGIGTPHDAGINTLYQGKFVSQGGCQGCHGVAQIKLGGDFSFLLDNIGKPVDSPDVVKNSSKLLKFIQGIEARTLQTKVIQAKSLK